MSDARRALGQQGEALAAAQLAAWGWRLRETNWRSTFGEIDIVAEDGDVLVIVEVRTRRAGPAGARFGSPEESVDWNKQARLIRLGEAYVAAVGWEGPWRIDVVAIELAADGSVVRLAHYPNVTEGV
jgi:putative endonuclease